MGLKLIKNNKETFIAFEDILIAKLKDKKVIFEKFDPNSNIGVDFLYCIKNEEIQRKIKTIANDYEKNGLKSIFFDYHNFCENCFSTKKLKINDWEIVLCDRCIKKNQLPKR